MDIQEALKRASQVYGVKPDEVKQVAVVMMALDEVVAHIRRTTNTKTILSSDIFDLLLFIQNDSTSSAPQLVKLIVKKWDRDRIRNVANTLVKKYQPSATGEFFKGFIVWLLSLGLIILFIMLVDHC